MKIDVIASEAHYLRHMLPIFEALPERLRGQVRVVEVGQAAKPAFARVAMVAGWQDVAPLRGLCPMIYVEHGAGQTYCLAPETLILTADLRWKPIGDLAVGEELIAFDEQRGGSRVRQWRSTAVTETRRLRLPCYEITFEDGTKVVASSEHKWLKRNRETAEWITTAKLQPVSTYGKYATKVLKVADVWAEDTSWGAGYLAAAFDGEGCLTQAPREGRANRIMLAYTQKPNPMMDAVQAELRRRCFDFTVSPGSPVPHLTLRGGLPEMLRFLGSIRPRRLMSKFQPPEGGMLKGKPLAVVQLQYVGERDVVGLSTGTGTLVAEGIASHNSDRAFDPSYSGSGGQRHHGVIGYICPSETVAARWRNAPAAAVGCPKLDLMAGLRAATDRSDDPPLVVFAWHWDCLLVPETRSALDHYVADLPALKERIEQQGWDVQHHFHPKWRGAPIDASNVLADEVSVFRWASLLVVDNSSLAYEAAALDIPVVLLNAPWYRRDVEHGLRFWEYPPGIQVDDPEHLMSLNLWDFVTPGTVHHRASEVLGKRAAEHAYTAVDGKASERAAAFITSLLDEM